MKRHETLELTELAGATGVWLFQWCVLIPGLLPILALTAVFALPLVALALIPVVMVGVPYGTWRLGRRALGALR
jgi:hypothetical protein